MKKAGGSVTTTFKKTVYMNKKGEPGKKAQRRAKSAEKKAARAATAMTHPSTSCWSRAI